MSSTHTKHKHCDQLLDNKLTTYLFVGGRTMFPPPPCANEIVSKLHPAARSPSSNGAVRAKVSRWASVTSALVSTRSALLAHTIGRRGIGAALAQQAGVEQPLHLVLCRGAVGIPQPDCRRFPCRGMQNTDVVVLGSVQVLLREHRVEPPDALGIVRSAIYSTCRCCWRGKSMGGCNRIRRGEDPGAQIDSLSRGASRRTMAVSCRGALMTRGVANTDAYDAANTSSCEMSSGDGTTPPPSGREPWRGCRVRWRTRSARCTLSVSRAMSAHERYVVYSTPADSGTNTASTSLDDPPVQCETAIPSAVPTKLAVIVCDVTFAVISPKLSRCLDRDKCICARVRIQQAKKCSFQRC
eukprot:m.1229737 g.1229737  ORF g.1229737 m.1229737 type:complete len:354 (+) comp24652_c1_seq17:3088-4149(+)